jgi:hypothetical protein
MVLGRFSDEQGLSASEIGETMIDQVAVATRGSSGVGVAALVQAASKRLRDNTCQMSLFMLAL